MIFVHESAKEYGTCRFAEGADIVGAHITLVEDVVTTGSAARTAMLVLRALGATVEQLCVPWTGAKMAPVHKGGPRAHGARPKVDPVGQGATQDQRPCHRVATRAMLHSCTKLRDAGRTNRQSEMPRGLPI